MLRTSIKQDTVACSRAAAAGSTSTLRSCDPLIAKIGVPCGWDPFSHVPLRVLQKPPCGGRYARYRPIPTAKPRNTAAATSHSSETATTAMAHFSRRLRALCNAPVRSLQYSLIIAPTIPPADLRASNCANSSTGASLHLPAGV
jgi:hypothetical protein